MRSPFSSMFTSPVIPENRIEWMRRCVCKTFKIRIFLIRVMRWEKSQGRWMMDSKGQSLAKVSRKRFDVVLVFN